MRIGMVQDGFDQTQHESEEVRANQEERQLNKGVGISLKIR